MPISVTASLNTSRLAFRELEKILGYDQCSHLEEVVNRQLSLEVRAYYLFGLGLRKQVLSGLGV